MDQASHRLRDLCKQQRRDRKQFPWQTLPFAALVLSLPAPCLFAVTPRPINTERSTVTIHVGKTGLLAAAGHEHIVTGPVAEGTIVESAPAHIAFRMKAAGLTVQPEDHQAEIQHAMQVEVLESARFPEIAFTSKVVQGTGEHRWIASGMLRLHGQEKPIQIHVHYQNGMYVGSTSIKQTDFGIRLVSAAGGTVRVKNELRIDFAIVAR